MIYTHNKPPPPYIFTERKLHPPDIGIEAPALTRIESVVVVVVVIVLVVVVVVAGCIK